MRPSTPVDDLRHRDALERLTRALQDLAMARNLEDLTRVVRRATRDIMEADGVTFVLRDGSSCLYVDEEAIAPLWKGQSFPLDACVSGWAMEHREPVIIEDIRDDSRVPQDAYRDTFVQSLVMMPIRTLDPVGVIGAYWATQRRPEDWELRVLQALADASAVTLDNLRAHDALADRVRERMRDLEEANRRLAVEVAERRQAEEEIRRLSLTDSLTSLANRRGFFVRAETVLKQARREEHDVAVLFVDVDGLKMVNDHLGHDQGDALLQDAAKVLRDLVRESDVLARLGGDEFAILATSDRPDRMRRRLQDAVEVFNEVYGRPYLLSMSVGIAPLKGHGNRDLDHALAEADQDMYTVKRRLGDDRGSRSVLRPPGGPGRVIGFGITGRA